ncbi:dual specificity tyrosine-phosphorylation-regulated kinase 4-like isoform X1 [Hoplias malabaricus]|uniref:dual specificity tyrosine-phosphorylation-regulated kinase 4-like isoform X1 n=2 Tax=Hoplias malabaricus TaxID=27720 RepID=UPI0034637B3D
MNTSRRQMEKAQKRTTFPAKGGKLDALPALPQIKTPQTGKAKLVPGNPRKLGVKPDALPQLKKPEAEKAQPGCPRRLGGKLDPLPQIKKPEARKPQMGPGYPKKPAGKLDALPALPQIKTPQTGKAKLVPGNPRKLGVKPDALPQLKKPEAEKAQPGCPRRLAGKLDALPQLKNPQAEKAQLGPGSTRNLNNGCHKLPQIKPKPQPAAFAKSKVQGVGTLPHINDKRQPSSSLTTHKRLNPETRPVQGNSSENSASNCSSFMQQHKRHLETYPLPMCPQDVQKNFGQRLTVFEQQEVLGYSEIWYLGLKAKKIHGCFGKAHNHGYDDKHGAYKQVIHDHLAYRYEVLGFIGQGTFGQVFKCRDHKTQKMVAIKIIRNNPSHHKQGMVELRMLHYLRRRNIDSTYNVIRMEEFFYFRNHLCFTFDLMGPNLDEKIKREGPYGFSQEMVRHFAEMLLKSLNILKEKKIVHSDLKPGNIVESQDGLGITVVDFGCSYNEDFRPRTGIGTRFYRPPELMLGQPSSCAIDMWSLGCILAELDMGRPLFPGADENDQIERIAEVIGLPPYYVLQTGYSRHRFFDVDESLNYTLKGKNRKPSSVDLAAVLNTDDPAFVDFIKRCLMWDPMMRLTPEEALRHPWIQGGTTGDSDSSESCEQC